MSVQVWKVPIEVPRHGVFVHTNGFGSGLLRFEDLTSVEVLHDLGLVASVVVRGVVNMGLTIVVVNIILSVVERVYIQNTQQETKSVDLDIDNFDDLEVDDDLLIA